MLMYDEFDTVGVRVCPPLLLLLSVEQLFGGVEEPVTSGVCAYSRPTIFIGGRASGQSQFRCSFGSLDVEESRLGHFMVEYK